MDLWFVQTYPDGELALAHRIVAGHEHSGMDCRISQCGVHWNVAGVGDRFWWSVPKGEVPLAEVKLIHCGLRTADL